MKAKGCAALLAVLVGLVLVRPIFADHINDCNREAIVTRVSDLYETPDGPRQDGAYLLVYLTVQIFECSPQKNWVRIYDSTFGYAGWLPADAVTRPSISHRFSKIGVTRYPTDVHIKPNEPYTIATLPQCHSVAVHEVSADGDWVYVTNEFFAIGWIRAEAVTDTTAEADEVCL